MSGVIKYDVIQPPTGAALEGEALAAIGENALMELVLLASEQQVPPPQNEVFSVRIRQIGRPMLNGLVITGFTEPDRRHVIIETSNNPDKAAKASIVGRS